jgi:hypothetical protein
MRFHGSAAGATGTLMPIIGTMVTIITGAGVVLVGSASPRHLDTVLTRSSVWPSTIPPESTLRDLSIKDEEVRVE